MVFYCIISYKDVSCLRKKFSNLFKYVFCVLALVGSYFVYQTGEYGGKMVFQHGVGTQFHIKSDEMRDSLKEIISNQQDKIDSLTSK